MNNQVFIPVTDDLIYNHPEQIEGPLIPYSAGMECSQWLSIEINPEEGEPELTQEIKVLNGKMIRTATSKKSNAKLTVVYPK